MHFQKKKLENGIIVVHESRDLPIVSLSITNKFGAGHETSDIKGIAHFIEHLLFTGTKTRTHEDISREIEKKGGILNAFTNHETTSLWFKLPSEHLFTGLEILSDMLINPLFEKEKFEKEKRVILEEIKMYKDNPLYHVYEQIEKNLFEKPFGELIIGSKETVSELDRDFVANYFEKVYAPENFIVTIVGNANFQKICEYLEQRFTKKNRTPIMGSITKKHTHTTEERPAIDQASFIFAIHAPLFIDPDFRALQVLDAYLASGMSSRLFLEIREKRGLAYEVTGNINAEKQYAYYTIFVGTTKQALPEIKKIILNELKDIQKMTNTNLQEAKERLIGLKKIMIEESTNVMNSLMYHELNGNAEDYYKFEDQINAVTLDQVKALAKIKNYSTAAIVPK